MAKAHECGYSIGEAARAAAVNAKTIRYYEDIGLIPRAQRRAADARTGGDRVYRESEIGRLRFIRQARLVDLSLDDIRELLKIADKGCPSTHPAYAELSVDAESAKYEGYAQIVSRRRWQRSP